MAVKSAAEKRHEEDVAKLSELIEKYKEDYDLCDEGFNDFIEEANSVLNKPLAIKGLVGSGTLDVTLGFSEVKLGTGTWGALVLDDDLKSKIEDAIYRALVDTPGFESVDFGSEDFYKD